jgi:ethanolamine ammonia-lyase small subunit
VSQTPRDPWAPLGRLTPARVAIGRAGGSLPTGAHLAFQLAHAQARDAVHHAANLNEVAARLAAAGLHPVLVQSAVPDRAIYLRRPDLGRRLSEAGHRTVAALARPGGTDLALVIADGLSGFAVERHAAAVAQMVAEPLRGDGWSLSPTVLVQQGRVAIGDEIGALLGARLVALLIGERPGLSSPDSLGAYLTFMPKPGHTDAERNCVSNIRTEGLSVAAAAVKLVWLLREARRRKLTGVGLKDEMGSVLPEFPA